MTEWKIIKCKHPKKYIVPYKREDEDDPLVPDWMDMFLQVCDKCKAYRVRDERGKKYFGRWRHI